MKTTLSYLLIAFFAFFASAELKAQDPCTLPTYSVNVSFAPGDVAFDLFQALTNDGYNFLGYENCYGYTGDGGCFYSNFIVNEALTPFGCAISQWEILLSPNANKEACCGDHLLPYYLSYNAPDGLTMFCEGFINITIDCGNDCGIIDFTV